MADKKTPREQEPEAMDAGDFQKAAEFVADLFSDRASNGDRQHLERIWKEVDRQRAMDPMARKPVSGKNANRWMPNLELPQQIQTHEVEVSDARRFLFPTDRNWFSARASMEDELLDRLNSKVLTPGLSEDNQRFAEIFETKRKVDQDDIDALVEGVLTHFQSMYDFRSAWDLLNGEAFSYGTFVGRARLVIDRKFDIDFRGVRPKESKFPAIIPRSIRNTYLDDSEHAFMHEGRKVSPSILEVSFQNLDDLRLAARDGAKGFIDEDAGWMPKMLEGLAPLKKNKNLVKLVEFDGDMLIPREGGGETLFHPNVIATVAIGQGDTRMVRYRQRAFPFQSYIIGTYHRADVRSPYGVGPLMMGAPIQKSATEALNRMMQAAALNTEPPVKWNPIDYNLQATGGPDLFPGASIQAKGEIEPIKIGDVQQLAGVLNFLIRMYEDVTGVNTPRLGGQTVSHTTAFAKDVEMNRGQTRIVDYVHTLLYGALPTWLSMDYEMARKALKKKGEPVFIPKWRAWVNVGSEDLPERVTFDVHGAAGPAEEQQALQKKLQALQLAMALEGPKRQLGGGKPLDLETLQRKILEYGGFTDIESLFSAAGGVGGPGAPQGIAGPGLSPALVEAAAAQR